MRTRIRNSTAAGLTVSLETPVGLVRAAFSPLWRPGKREGPEPRIDLDVRLVWPAPEPGPLNVVRNVGVSGRIAAQFTPHGVVLAELVGSRALRVVRVDAELREGVVECSPEVLAERPCDPLGALGPILLHHRLVRDGAASLLACVARTSAGTLVFATASDGVRNRLRRRLERGQPNWLLEGGFVVRSTVGGTTLEQTPWTRAGLRRPDTIGRVLVWHAARLAPALLAEPLRGRLAAEALLHASALLPGDELAESLQREVIERLVERERTVRLGFPDDERLLRYAFGRSSARVASSHSQAGR